MTSSARSRLAFVALVLSVLPGCSQCSEPPDRAALPPTAPTPPPAPAPAPPAEPAPAVPPPSPGPQPDHATPGLANARALPVGAEVAIDVTCEGGPIYVGPFAFTQHGQGVSFTSWHSEVPQTCVGGSWVDATGAFIQVAGFGCSDSGTRAESTNVYDYRPDSGENSATPVFLQLAFTGDPAPTTCPPSRVHLTRTR
jgi:hypothetical protein